MEATDWKVQRPEVQGETRKGCVVHRIRLIWHRDLETAEAITVEVLMEKAVDALHESLVGRRNGAIPKVVYGSDDIAKYQYNMEILQEDRIMYRAGNAQNPYGRWFTSEPPASVAKVRIDTAVKPYWIDTKTGVQTGSSYVENVYAIKIPKGTTIYTGPVGPQGVYM